VKNIEKHNLTEKYDRFVLNRSDQYYECAQNVSALDNKYIWVPEGQDYGGICDRQLIANSKDFVDLIDVWPYMIANPSITFNKDTNPEQVLKGFSLSIFCIFSI
jgi:hypothetical protein